MKLRLEQISNGEEEVIVRYRQMTPTVQAISDLVAKGSEKILGRNEQGERYLFLDDILYFESIDSKTFAYTQKDVWQVACSLKDLVTSYAFKGFFRCAKAMVLNLYRIEYFKSQSFGRIEATLDNGEIVVISRKYAGRLRQLLEEGVRDEG